MGSEKIVLIYSMINNLLIAIIKVVGGFVFDFSSLFADGLHTFSDFITDLVSLIGIKISKKRPTKDHPFGFGRIQYLTNLFVSMILLLLGLYIIFSSFSTDIEVPPISLLILLLVAGIMKLISIFFMYRLGKKTNSSALITSVLESKADLYSSIGVAIIIILLQFTEQVPILRYADMVGSIIIGLIVLKTAIKILVDNSLALLGETDNDEELIKEINEHLYKLKGIEKTKIYLIKYGDYYKLQLVLQIDDHLTLRRMVNLEKSIKTSILKDKKLKIKYITIFINSIG